MPADADVGTAVDVGGGRAHVTEPPGFLAPEQVYGLMQHKPLDRSQAKLFLP